MAWLRPILTLLAVLGAIVVNGVSNAAPPNGESVADLSNIVFRDVLIIPASYAFAIWGLIYIGLVALGIYQLPASQHENPRLNPHSYFLVLASLAQCLWIYLFLTRQFGLSLLAMVEILLFLAAFYLRLRWALPSAKGSPQRLRRATSGDRWFIQRPISLYLGWISVATIVNAAIALYSWGWRGGWLSGEVWTAVLMAIATFLAMRLLVQYGDVTFVGVIVWALVAISLKNLAVPVIAIVGFLLAALLVLLSLLQRQPRSTVRP